MWTFLFDPASLSILGNPPKAWGISLTVFVGLIIVLFAGLFVVVRVLKMVSAKTKNGLDDLVAVSLEKIPRWTLGLVALLAALHTLSFPILVSRTITGLLLAVIVGVVITLVQRLVEYLLLRRMDRFRRSEQQELPPVLRATIAVMLWSVGIVLVLSNIGVNVVSLIAGLGIGGIAIALAAQNVLSDVFSSYSIYLDQPFEEGDFIIVGQHKGTVKKIGIKTTRIKALQGEEIVIANKELTETRVQNYKRMRERRVVLQFGVEYSTKLAKLRDVPKMIEEIITSRNELRFDRAHFFQFGDSSLNFEVVYFIATSDYNAYMDSQQAVNLAIMERFEKEEIAFAFPTRTVHVVEAKT